MPGTCGGERCGGHFRCAGGDCIPSYRKCDGRPDCADGSDESPEGCEEDCAEGYFRCSGGQCVSAMWTCDGGVDCPDGSDEAVELCGTG